MQCFGEVGRNTFYFSPSNFKPGNFYTVRVYGTDKKLLEEITVDELERGLYYFDKDFPVRGKYLALILEGGNPIIMGTILIVEDLFTVARVFVPGNKC